MITKLCGGVCGFEEMQRPMLIEKEVSVRGLQSERGEWD
jgi:hypothetical protein